MKFLSLLLFSSLSFASTDVFLAEIRGTINPASASYLEAAIKKAEQAQAQALLVELDTPGGLVTSTRTMAQAVDASSIPVVVFVTPAGASATSAGALLMLSSHVAVMSPGTNIGAAHPVTQQGKEAEGKMGEKVLNDVKAFARSLAELRKRPVKVAEEVVSKSRSMTAAEAEKEKFVDFLADTRGELLKKLDGRRVKIRDRSVVMNVRDSRVTPIEMSPGQKLLHMLANPNIAAILMTLAMLLIYVELSNPGITIAGVLGLVCLLIAFMAFQTLPIQMGGIALLILGMILLVAELFVTTGGVLAAGGLISFILGMLWAMDPNETDLRIRTDILVALSVGLGTTVGILIWAATRTRRLSRETREKIGGGGALVGLTGYAGVMESVDSDGLHGKAVFRGEVWDVVSPKPLTVGQNVIAQKVKGFTVHVKPGRSS